VIYDKYPKAFQHLLVLPRHTVTLDELTANDVSLIERMKEKGELVIKQLQGRHKNSEFRMGFHAVPSLRQLHMHIISQDFDAEGLKNKKHWLSFTTEFFVPPDKLMDLLQMHGAIKLDKQKYLDLLKGPLRCHKCAHVAPTIPKLKGHILSHE